MSLMPTGVLIPVLSISILVLIGMVQALVSPGNWMDALSSEISSSRVTARFSAQIMPRADRANPGSGQSEYQR